MEASFFLSLISQKALDKDTCDEKKKKNHVSMTLLQARLRPYLGVAYAIYEEMFP